MIRTLINRLTTPQTAEDLWNDADIRLMNQRELADLPMPRQAKGFTVPLATCCPQG